jgi:hypothetical protein
MCRKLASAGCLMIGLLVASTTAHAQRWVGQPGAVGGQIAQIW